MLNSFWNIIIRPNDARSSDQRKDNAKDNANKLENRVLRHITYKMLYFKHIKYIRRFEQFKSNQS